jgi:hypothetical protein
MLQVIDCERTSSEHIEIRAEARTLFWYEPYDTTQASVQPAPHFSERLSKPDLSRGVQAKKGVNCACVINSWTLGPLERQRKCRNNDIGTRICCADLLSRYHR